MSAMRIQFWHLLQVEYLALKMRHCSEVKLEEDLTFLEKVLQCTYLPVKEKILSCWVRWHMSVIPAKLRPS